VNFVDYFCVLVDNHRMERNHTLSIAPLHMHKLRHWERKNLPHYGKEAGYLLFLELSKAGGASNEMLKEFYLSMPYAESTMRLLFRNMESDGWIEMPNKAGDRRVRQFVLTDKFHQKRDEWLRVASDIISTPLEANRQSN
jgi:hypothetical protein